MKSKFSQIVSKYLFTYGSVGIPGIGTFSISESSSGFTLKNHVISPPTRMVDFSEEISDEEGLVKYLKNNHDYSRKDAEKKISEYSKKFLNDLLNYGVANIPGIGKLNKYANGEFVFEPAKEYLITSNYMLPEIKLTPIDNTAVVKELNPTPKAAPVRPVPTAATAAAFLGATQDPIKKPAPIKPIADPKPAVEAKPLAEVKAKAPVVKPEIKQPAPIEKKPLVKKEPVVSTPIRKEPTPIVYEEEPGFWKTWKWPILLLLGIIGLSVFGVKCAKDLFSGETSLGEKFTEATQKITGDSKAAELSIDDYLKDKPNLQKYAKFLTKEIVDEGCVIIVGTFDKPRNVIRMKDRLARAGLSPYTESHNGLTRVGVLFPCQEHDLEGYIDTLRSSFNRDAWYLKPQMDVAKK